jgi:hypothetical protein
MNVKKEGSLLLVVAYLLLQPKDLRVAFLAGELPLPVDVSTRNVRSVVTTDDSVNVDHGDYPKLISVSQLLGLSAAGEQEIDESLNNIRGGGFSGVLSADDVDELSVSLFFVGEVGDVQNVDGIAH